MQLPIIMEMQQKKNSMVLILCQMYLWQRHLYITEDFIMKWILDEITIGWKRDFWFVFLLLGLSIAGIFCIGTAWHLLLETEEQTEEYKEVYEDTQFYTIVDNFVGEADAELSEQNVGRFHKFLELLSGSNYFEYFMAYTQSVSIENYRGKESNIYGYEHGVNLDSATREIKDKDGNVQRKTGVKAFWIGDNVIDYFKLRLREGREFTEDDFVLKTDGPISVILGANYAEEYSVGDELLISCYFVKRTAEVAGFLEEGTNFYYRGKFLNLDNYVIMPVFQNDTYEGKEVFGSDTVHFYTLRNSGIIATKLSMGDVEEIIKDYSREAGFEHLNNAYYVVEYVGTEKINFDYGIEVVSFLVSAIAAAALAAAFLFVGVCTANRTKKNRRYFAVLAMNGCGKGQICSILLLDTAVIELLAGLLAGVLFTAVFGTATLWGTGVLWGLLLGTAFFTALPCAVTMILFFRRDLIYYLKEETGDADIGQRDEAI